MAHLGEKAPLTGGNETAGKGPAVGKVRCGSGVRGARPPGTDATDLLEDGVALVRVLGGGDLGLELGHLCLAVVAAFQLHAAFNHDRSSHWSWVARALRRVWRIFLRGLDRACKPGWFV